MSKWLNKWFGKRIIKTALSVFITAWICDLLNWPAIFAVITAIVTIEPSLASSIRKGYVRLPAAAMSTALAMTFDYLFGQVPLTYALSASLTIYLCHLLRWHDAMMVATLTAVAMIPMTEEHFLQAFFIRLGTTSTGIIVSTLVNFIVMPPNFSTEISRACTTLNKEIKQLLKESLYFQFNLVGSRSNLHQRLSKLMKDMDRATQLIQHQRDEYRYHHHEKEDIKRLIQYQHKLGNLQKVSFHIGDILSLDFDNQQLSEADKQTLLKAWEMIDREWQELGQDQPQTERVIAHLLHVLHDQSDHTHHHLTKSCAISYELLAISSIMKEQRKIVKEQQKGL